MRNVWSITVLLILVISLSLGGVACKGETVNQLPVISSFGADAASVAVGGSVTVTCIADDPDGDSLSFAWSCTGGSLSRTGYSVTWEAPDTTGSYSISVTVTDGRGGSAEASCPVTVVPGPANQPPVIKSLSFSLKSVEPERRGTVTCEAVDPDGDPLTYEWWAELGRIEGEGNAVTYVAPPYVGEYEVKVHVRDNRYGNAVESIMVTVAENEPPEIDIVRADPDIVITNYGSTITCTADDPDGDPLTYTWSADGGTLSGEGDTVAWMAPGRAGYFTITVTVDDGRGGFDTSDVTVQVQGLNIVINLDPVSGESGSIKSDGTVLSLRTVGDDSIDNGIKTYLSFDVSKIKMVEEFRLATLVIETQDRNGTPWSDLGDLCIDVVDYGTGPLVRGDYEVEGVRLERFTAAPLPEIDVTQLISQALRDKEDRFQIMIYFHSETDGDGVSDNLKVIKAVLHTYYVEKTD